MHTKIIILISNYFFHIQKVSVFCKSNAHIKRLENIFFFFPPLRKQAYSIILNFYHQKNELFQIKFLYFFVFLLKKKVIEKSPWNAAITNRSPSQTPRGRGNRQNQASTNRTNVRKVLRLAFFFPKRGNHNAKRTGKHKNKIAQGKT